MLFFLKHHDLHEKCRLKNISDGISSLRNNRIRLSGFLPDISDSRLHPKTYATKSKPMSNERLLWVR